MPFVPADWRTVPSFLTPVAESADGLNLPFLVLPAGPGARPRLVLPASYVDVMFAAGATASQAAIRALCAVGYKQLADIREVGGTPALTYAVQAFIKP